MRRNKVFGVLALLLPLALLAPAAAQAATGPWVLDADLPVFTYRDQVASRSNIQYSEGALAPSYYRKGVAAYVHGASGYTWQTTVWLGTVSTSGASSARLKDSQLGSKKTWGKFVFLPDPNNTDTIKFSIWLANVVGASRVAAPTAGDVSSVGDPIDPIESPISTVATDTSVIPGFGSVGENVPDAVESTFESLGSFDGYDVWTVQDTSGTVHLLASDGSFLAQTESSQEDFAQVGVPLRIDTPDGAVQFELLPSDELDATALVDAGFAEVSSVLYATAAPAAQYSVVELPVVAARGGSGVGGVTVPLFIPPAP